MSIEKGPSEIEQKNKKFIGRGIGGELSPSELDEYRSLLNSSEGVLSPQEREQLICFGNYHLGIKNGFEAMRAFAAAVDFNGLRRTADWYLREQPDDSDLIAVLKMLGDNQAIRDLLNRDDIEHSDAVFGNTFCSLDDSLAWHIKKFYDRNRIDPHTISGKINTGIDLVAIHNLASIHDIAVPIANAGLLQGAIADLWGMPTRIVDVSAHGEKIPRSKWVNSVTTRDFKNKNVLLLDNDAESGATINEALRILSSFDYHRISVYFAYDVAPEKALGGTKTKGLPAQIEVFGPHNAPKSNAGDVYIKACKRLTLYGQDLLEQQNMSDDDKKIFLKMIKRVRFPWHETVDRSMGLFNERRNALVGLLDFNHELSFNFEMASLETPEKEAMFWEQAVPIKTIEERYMQKNFGGWLPKMLKYTPDEVAKINVIVHQMNNALKVRNAKIYKEMYEQGRTFIKSIQKNTWGGME